MYKFLALFLWLMVLLQAKEPLEKTYSDYEMKQYIGKLLLVGFEGETVNDKSEIYQLIQKHNLGGVILFDRYYHERGRVKNIRNPLQLRHLNHALQAIRDKPLFICVDQEGGRVARLKEAYGFQATPSARAIGENGDLASAQTLYESLAKMLRDTGVNCDAAPVVDLSVNLNNKVIYQLGRSYGKSPKKVAAYARVFMQALHKNGVISILKHFPGHGSSLGDSHQGFVDVSQTWSAVELEPYATLIATGSVDMIMTAHVFNRHLDPNYPATLSYAVNTSLLREKMGYDGVIISDDMQMKAIAEHYSLKETVTLALNAGVDILLFGNQLATQDTLELIDIIYEQVKAGAIKPSRILEANQRINILYDTLKKKGENSLEIVEKPIDFSSKRVLMTQKYIARHYGLAVDDIGITPRVVVLHWTAVEGLETSFAVQCNTTTRGVIPISSTAKP